MDQDMDQEVALRSALPQERLADAGRLLRQLRPVEVERVLDRSDPHQVPIVFRLMDQELAVRVFAALDPRQQSQLIRGLRDENLQQMLGQLHASSQARLQAGTTAEHALRQIHEAGIVGRLRDRRVGLPVVDAHHQVLGTVGLADLVCAAGDR